MFFDNGRPAYIALPDLHLVCKPCKELNRRMLSAGVSSHDFTLTSSLASLCLFVVQNMSEDLEDEACRADIEEYLQTYPNPIFVVMRVGQDVRVDCDGQFKSCTISQLDGSLIQVCYKVSP